jgi:hypothetical protein
MNETYSMISPAANSASQPAPRLINATGLGQSYCITRNLRLHDFFISIASSGK